MAKIQLPVSMVFERHEKKYRLTQAQYELLLPRLDQWMQRDQYGVHTICSLYFDTEDFLLIRRSLQKPRYKEKLRLRSYGVPADDDIVYLELKKKLNGVTYKRRASMPFAQARAWLTGHELPDGQILREIDYFLSLYHPLPRIALFYERLALFGREDNRLRVTFDTDIRWRRGDLAFAEGDAGALLLQPGERLMEIKTPGAIPLDLARLLSELRIYPVSFSKYGEAYKALCKEDASIAL